MEIKKPEADSVKYRVYDKNGQLKRAIEKTKEKDEITNEDWLRGVSCFVINPKNNKVLIERRVPRGLNSRKIRLMFRSLR